MKQAQIDVAIWQEKNAFVSQCLNVDVASYGNTPEEAANSLKEAVELYFEDAAEEDINKTLAAVQNNIPLPPENSLKRTISLDIDS